MSQLGNENDGQALFLRLSVPAEGGLRAVASEVATRVAEYLGSNRLDAESAGVTLEGLAARVAAGASGGDIQFEFREVDRELLIRARCDERSLEVRYPLPA
ncbi:MAG TPA: hypothetical protein VD833_16170 [Vicinamibacterales bacterium]|nr:hypothetical protein [Vicinamibacterales bacterium]